MAIIRSTYCGLIKAWVPTKILSPHFGHGNKTIITVVFIGAPLPLCSCGLSPVATELKRLGALVFMMAGPATHISTLGVIKNEMSSNVLIKYLGGISISAISFGLLLD
jgi:uncharacterized membrane protein YraQ (UPF0718 family)